MNFILFYSIYFILFKFTINLLPPPPRLLFTGYLLLLPLFLIRFFFLRAILSSSIPNCSITSTSRCWASTASRSSRSARPRSSSSASRARASCAARTWRPEGLTSPRWTGSCSTTLPTTPKGTFTELAGRPEARLLPDELFCSFCLRRRRFWSICVLPRSPCKSTNSPRTK